MLLQILQAAACERGHERAIKATMPEWKTRASAAKEARVAASHCLQDAVLGKALPRLRAAVADHAATCPAMVPCTYLLRVGSLHRLAQPDVTSRVTPIGARRGQAAATAHVGCCG